MGSVQRLGCRTREALRVAASVDGLQAKVTAKINMHDLAREAVAFSHAGLKARARAAQAAWCRTRRIS